MGDNVKDLNTPGGNCSSSNTPVTNVAAGSRILEDPSTMPIDNNEKHKKKTTEYQRAKRQLVSARRIIEKANEAAAQGRESSAEHEEKLKWAKEIVENITDEKLKSLSDLSVVEKRDQLKKSKRIRSDDSVEDLSKKQKTSSLNSSIKTNTIILDKLPYCDVVKLSMRLVIVDIGSPDWRISIDKFQKIEKHIIKQLYKFVVENPTNVVGPAYTMNEKLRGHHIITCDSQAAVDFIRFAVGNAGQLWEGADLQVKELHELPLPIKMFVAIPNVEGEKDQNKIIMALLRIQNPLLKVERWKILNQVNLPNSNRILYTFIIDLDSRNIIEKNDHFLHYGVRRCKVKITKDHNQESDEKELINQLVEHLMVEDENEEDNSSEGMDSTS